jgi:radical SAM superfamily enzyme YgiQ (UPF0313 family)
MFPINYDEPVFRPPSEAYSLIFQVTLGCSWNKCTFCDMYKTKHFRPRDEADILKEIHLASRYYQRVRKIFLADGNAMVLSTERLLTILDAIKKYFPGLQRVSAYALPADILAKPMEQLIALREAGLKLLYVGIESGDDDVLSMVNKSESVNSTISGLEKAHQAGLKCSVMIVNGLAGKNYSRQHAINSAAILNKIQPLYFSTLVLMLPKGVESYKASFKGDYVHMEMDDLLEEMALLIEHTELDRTIFRSDHASNYLPLKGVLGRDKEKLIEIIRRYTG